jgi:hypothetical protein
MRGRSVMWIWTQSKETLIKCELITIGDVATIKGIEQPVGIYRAGLCLGLYESKARALAVIAEIAASINDKKVFEMPER